MAAITSAGQTPAAASTTAASTGFDWGSLLGALGSAGASYYAGQQMTDAQKQALGAQMAAANTAGAQLAPYQAIGSSAAESLRTGDYTGSQLYKTGLSQSEQAINRGLASRGQYGSGGAVKALGENAQNYNTNYTNTLANLANLGLGATRSANQITTGSGNAQAASGIGQTQSNLAALLGMANTAGSYLSGKNSSGQSNLSGLAGLIGSAGSSISDWMNKGNTLEGENVIDWYNKNYGDYKDSSVPDQDAQNYYDQGESSDTSWMDYWL